MCVKRYDLHFVLLTNLPRFKGTLGKPFQEELIRGLLFRVDHLDALQKIFPLF